MPTHKLVSVAVVGATIAVIAATFDAPPSFAATTAAAPDADARYHQDRANCRDGRTTEDEKTCLREAGARLQASRAHQLTTLPASELAANARKRCDAFKNADDKRSCLERLDDGTVTGSVAGGGQLREYRELVPSPEAMPPTAAGNPPAPAPAPTDAPTPTPPLPQGQ